MVWMLVTRRLAQNHIDRKSTRLNSSHDQTSYAVFCLKKKTDTTLEGLAKLRPTFSTDATVTTGSSSGITAAVAAMVLKNESRARPAGRLPLARLLAFA